MASSSLDVAITGDGRPLVLLHSLLVDRSAFDHLVKRLADRRRLIAVNLPGFGISPPGGPTVKDYARAVQRLLDELDLPPETDVLGNGFGSFVALSLASEVGSRIARLVLVGAAIAFPPAGKDTFKDLAAKVESEGMAAIVPLALKRLFPEGYLVANPKLAAERAAVLEALKPTHFANACRALAALDLTPELPKVENPTLIVVGQEDGATPPALAHALAEKLSDGRVVEMRGVGHSPHIQAPDRFVSTIATFLGLA